MIDAGALALALVAGAAATFNPCGFALLPAYLAILVARDDPPVGRAVRFAGGMTVGFVAVFGLFALVVAPLALAVERWLPVVTVVIGALLVCLGIWLLSGRELRLPTLRFGWAPTGSWVSQIGYGVTFALASLSCTIAPFLAVTTAALRTGSVPGVVAVFLTYSLGMGAVVAALALLGTTTTARLRRATPVIARLSGLLLVVAGGYVTWYGWFELRVLGGAAASDPVVSAATQVQSWLVRGITAPGAVGILLLAVLVASGSVAWYLRRHRVADSSHRKG